MIDSISPSLKPIDWSVPSEIEEAPGILAAAGEVPVIEPAVVLTCVVDCVPEVVVPVVCPNVLNEIMKATTINASEE